jgi:hypothetical protein
VCHNRLEVIQSNLAQRERLEFVTAPYVLDEHGEYRCVGGLNECPKGKSDEGCRIKRQARRRRKTGPEFPLDVLLCHTHQGSFTVYPPAFEPWGRKALAPLAPNGEALESVVPVKAGPGLWRGTSFRCSPRCCRGPAVDPRAHRR